MWEFPPLMPPTDTRLPAMCDLDSVSLRQDKTNHLLRHRELIGRSYRDVVIASSRRFAIVPNPIDG
jgi:hypothetical protein